MNCEYCDKDVQGHMMMNVLTPIEVNADVVTFEDMQDKRVVFVCEQCEMNIDLFITLNLKARRETNKEGK